MDLVRNGGFERGTNREPFLPLDPGSKDLPGWAVIRDGIDVKSTYWQPAAGQRSIDLNGFERGGVAQRIDTEIGQQYVLSFALAGNPFGQDEYTLTLRVNGERLRFDFDSTGRTPSDMGWETISVAFTATESRTRIAFLGDATEDVHGPAIDAVGVVAVPPTADDPWS